MYLPRGETGFVPECRRAPQYEQTSLHIAAWQGHASVAEQLLAAGAAVNMKNEVWGERRG